MFFNKGFLIILEYYLPIHLVAKGQNHLKTKHQPSTPSTHHPHPSCPRAVPSVLALGGGAGK